MTFQLNATLQFTFSRPTTDPIVVKPQEDVTAGTWRRFQRTMKGEFTGTFRPYLLAWDDAPPRTKTLAVVIDELADERRWHEVQVLTGLLDVVKPRGEGEQPEPPVEVGVLVCCRHKDTWNREKPGKGASLNWLDGAIYASDPSALKAGVEQTLGTVHDWMEFHSIECFTVNTAMASLTPLEYDGPVPSTPAPAIA